jgi:hypothetical protein
MFETLDELTFDAEEDGVLVRKQIERHVITEGAWATVMFLYQELDRAQGSFRAPKMSIVRFQKVRGAYRKHSSFNLAGEAQARRLTDVLESWYPKIRALAPEAHEPDSEDDGETVEAW